MMTKEAIDNWFVVTQNEITTAFKGMCAKKNYLQYWTDLYSNTYLYTIKMEFQDELQLKRTVLNYAKKQLEWSLTTTKREISDVRQQLEDDIYNFDIEDDITDYDEKLEIEYDYQLQLAAIFTYQQQLTKKEDKILFDLYFNYGCTSKDKLHNHLKKQNKVISKSSCAKLIANMRKNITNIYVENGGKLGWLQNQKEFKQ